MSIPKCPDKEFTILPIGMDKEPVVPSLRRPKWPRQPPEDSSSCRGYSCYGLSISVSALVLLSMGANRMGDILIRVLTCVHFSRVGGGLWHLGSWSCNSCSCKCAQLTNGNVCVHLRRGMAEEGWREEGK